MRLDHLLSKEKNHEKWLTLVSQEKLLGALFDFEGAENGGVAQLGEHLPCTQRVRSSILLISTKEGA